MPHEMGIRAYRRSEEVSEHATGNPLLEARYDVAIAVLAEVKAGHFTLIGCISHRSRQHDRKAVAP